jgi:arabinose-5-phosphate isomerase
MEDSIRQFARQVLEAEAAAVARLAQGLDEGFERAAAMILDCRGAVLTSGVGKAGIIARKLAATFSSTGTPSHFLNPADALHGDVGAIRQGDLVLILSYSGESEEICRLVSVVRKLGHPIIAMTSHERSTLGQAAAVVLRLGQIDEACPLGLAPSATTTAMLALGDALALAVMRQRDFTAADFAVFHPAGQLGRKLIRVREAMTFRRGENLPVARDNLTVAQVLREVSGIKRRSGAVVLIDADGRLSGLFADSDLRRLLTGGDASVLDRPIAQVMTRNPRRIHQEALASEVMAIMKEYRIDEVPVVDDEGRPVGLIDVQDLVVLKLFDVGPET